MPASVARFFAAGKILVAVVLCVAAANLVPSPSLAQQVGTVAASAVTGKSVGLPAYFEPNLGQAIEQADYVGRNIGYGVALDGKGFTILAAADDELQSLRFRFRGSNDGVVLRGEGDLPGRSHYYRGNIAESWVTDVPQYREVRAEDVYRGIDVVYRLDGARLRFDIHLEPGADPSSIDLALDESAEPELLENGAIAVPTAAGTLAVLAPQVYQDIAGQRHAVSARFTLGADSGVRVELGDYDPSAAVVIDPTVAFSTYFGTARGDWAASIELDSQDLIYLAGNGVDFMDPNGDITSLYIARLSKDGSQLQFQTSFGGSGWAGFEDQDLVYDVTTEDDGHSWVVGRTNSADFPTTAAAYDTSLGPVAGAETDGFFTRFTPQGLLTYSSYLGGDGLAQARAAAIAIDSLFITGGAADGDFTTTENAFDRDCGADGDGICDNDSSEDAFLMRFDGVGSGVLALGYSTYIGGQPIICDPGNGLFEIRDGREEGLDIEVDARGRAYVFGQTRSSDDPNTASVNEGFPVRNGYDETYPVDICDTNDRWVQNEELFLSIFDTSLDNDASLIYSTYIGGVDEEEAGGLAIEPDCDVDAQCSVYITGSSESADVLEGRVAPNTPYSDTLNGRSDIFVIKLDPYTPGVQGLQYFTLLGGSMAESQPDIAIPRSCTSDCPAYLVGRTLSDDFPERLPITPRHRSPQDMFVTRLYPDASWFSYSTLYGGADMEFPFGIEVDDGGSVYVAGQTSSVDDPATMSDDEGFPTTSGTAQAGFGGGVLDGFVFRFCDAGLSADPNPLDFGGVLVQTSSTRQVTFTNDCGLTDTAATASRIIGINFEIDGDTCSGAGILRPGDSCVIDVTFSPTTDGDWEATLELDLANNDRLVMSVIGRGTAGAIDVSPTFLDFGDQAVGTTSAPSTLTVTNTAAADILFNDLVIAGPNPGNFSIEPTSTCAPTGSLGPAASCSIDISFTPNNFGAREAELRILSNDPGGSTIVPLSGNGLIGAGSISVAPDTLDFGFVLVDQSSVLSATVTNSGNTGVRLFPIDGNSLSGSHPSDFALTHDCPAQLGGGASCQIDVTFSPVGGGMRSATLSVESDAAGSPHTVRLLGEAGRRLLEFNRASIDFGTAAGSDPPITRDVVATNVGTGMVTITSTTLINDRLGFPTASAFSTASNSCGGELPVGESCTISITYSPSNAALINGVDREGGIFRGTLTVESDARDAPHVFDLLAILRTSKGGSFCFIATAAYGSSLEPRVVTLRRFRDEWLMKHELGRAFVDFYYSVSPPIAVAIAGNETARSVVRGLLYPVVYVAERILENQDEASSEE